MKLYLMLSVLIFLIACNTNKVSVKLKNDSQIDFKKVSVKLGDTIKTFENLRSGETTNSFQTNKTYGYGFTSKLFKVT